jgi:hypothetical protein
MQPAAAKRAGNRTTLLSGCPVSGAEHPVAQASGAQAAQFADAPVNLQGR